MAINLKGYRITVLCEDINQFDFICEYIKLLDADKKPMRLPAHNNATVLKLYPNAVKSYREHGEEKIILLAMIDADEKTISERIRSFDKALDEEKARLNQSTRLDNEKILLFVPIRNIESWFEYIKYNTDVETLKDINGKLMSYKDQYQNQDTDIVEFAKKLKEHICADGLPENVPSSLHHACNELNRLKL